MLHQISPCLLSLLGSIFLLVVEEYDGEDEHPEHHGEAGGVVRVGGADEPLVLGVTQRVHRHLNLFSNLITSFIIIFRDEDLIL